MTTTKKMIGIAALAIASLLNTASAQQPSVEAAPAKSAASLLGVRYAGASVGYTNILHSDVDSFGIGAVINMPVNSTLDVGASIGHNWAEARHSIDGQTIMGYVTSHRDEGFHSPFFRVGLGGQISNNWDDSFLWSVQGGTEIEVNNALVVVATVNVKDDFRGKLRDVGFSGTVGANYAVSKSLVVSVDGTYYEHGHLGTSVGVAFKF